MKKELLINHLRRQGFSEKVVMAFENVKREDFIPEDYRAYSYEDIALPIGYGATISQPSTIAFMLSLLDLHENQKILEIGSGSGYVLALLSEITRGKIFGVEINKPIADKSKKILKDYRNVKVFARSGKNGLVKYAPYDRVLVSASASEIPQEIVKQLKSDGVMVIPVKESIIRVKKSHGAIQTEEFPGFAFVPFIED